MAWTQADIDKLKSAIAKGEKAVQFADRSVTLKSTAEMIEALKIMTAELSTARRVFYVAADQGF